MSRKISISVPYKVIAVFGPDPVGDNGKDELIYHCPECDSRHGSTDTKGKLYVNVKTLKYHCFRCGYSGQIGSVRVDESKVYEEDQSQDMSELIQSIESIEGVSPKFNLKIPIESVLESDKATSYLINRGFTERQLEYYDMRVGNLENEFGRIVIPNQVDHLVYTDFYSARTYIDQTPKYHNPYQAKSKTVFNLHRVEEGAPIIVVEGALTAVAAGYHAVATLGKTITRDQASLIMQKHPSIIYLNYDYGAETFSRRACQMLHSVDPSVPIMQVLMRDDRDAADLTHAEYSQCLMNAIKYEPIFQDLSEILDDED